jgi:DNA polymerase-1
VNATYVLVDGSGFIHRAFHAFPPLTDDKNRPVGALYGFARLLLPLLIQAGRNALHVFFDAGKQTFRHKLYPMYKAHRAETPADLVFQFPLVRQFCAAFGVSHYEHPDFEADDLIASFATQIPISPQACTVVSVDKDLLQLLNPTVSVYDPIKKVFVVSEDVIAKYGVSPEQMIDFQALVGDQSDGVPGVPGIGPKTAATLLQTHRSLEDIYAHLHELPSRNIRDKIGANKDLAFLSRTLVTLRRDIPISLDKSSRPFDQDRARDFLEDFSFHSLTPFLDRLAQRLSAA